MDTRPRATDSDTTGGLAPGRRAAAARRAAGALVVGAALTAATGAVVQALVQPFTDVADDRWSYPLSPAVLVPVSLFYAALHVLVFVGLFGFGRSGAVGRSGGGRVGIGLALAGTAALCAGELASIPIRHAATDDTGAQLVGALFGLGTVLSAVGFLLAGRAAIGARFWTDWRRFTPLVTGLWLIVLVGLAMTKALAAGVGTYGLCLLAMGIALYTRPLGSGAVPAGAASQSEVPGRTPAADPVGLSAGA